MPAVDDYAHPLATWLLVALALDQAPAGLSVMRVVADVSARTLGRCARPATIRAVLARMVEDGCAVVTTMRHGRRFPSHIHTLTDQGTAIMRQALAHLEHALGARHGHPQSKARRTR